MAETVTQRNEMSLKDKLRQKTFVEHFHNIDWAKISAFPMVVEFDPTTACNLACPDCINRDLLNQGFFSRERIRELTKEMVDVGVKAVILIGGGEPLMHQEIDWVIEYLGTHDVKIGLTTNGLFLDKYLEIISKYVNWVRVSVDAATIDTYRRIRPSRTGEPMFEKLIENLRAYAHKKQGTLGYSFMIYSEGEFDRSSNGKASSTADSHIFSNINEIYLGAKLAKEIGCNYFELKPMYNINHFAICQRKELISHINEEIKKSLNLVDDQFRFIKATKLKKTLSGEDSIEQKDYTRCAMTQLRTLVTPSGVYVCPYFRGVASKKIGDVRKTSFADMWHGEQRQKIIENLNPSRDCKMPCIRHESNLILEDMIAGEIFEIIDDFDLFI